MSTKNQRLNATITIGSVLEQSVRRNVGFLRTGLAQVGDSIKSVERRQRELDRQRNVLRRQGQSVAYLDREYEQLERTLIDLRRAQERWNRAAAASRRVGSTFNNMATDIGRNVRRLTVGATLAGGAIFGIASSTAKLGDDVAKTADKLNIGIEELQELRYAAERSGIATAAFDTSLEKMTRNIGLAMEGTGAQKDALDALGLSASDLATMLPEEALGVIADRMQGVGTQAEKAAIAADLFGRSGISMLNMLRDGSTGLTRLRDDARRTGYVLSEQAARDAEVLQDTLLDTQLVMKGLKNTVGAELLPVVTQAMRRIGDSLVTNREDVQSWATTFAEGVERVLPLAGDVARGIGRIGSVIWRVVEGTARLVGGWENFGIALGAVLASRTVLRIGQFAAAVFGLGKAMVSIALATPMLLGGLRAVGALLLANPIGIAVAGIAGAAYLIFKNWGEVAPWFGRLWENVQDVFRSFSDFVGGVFGLDMQRTTEGLLSLWENTGAVFATILGGIGSTFRTTYDRVIKPVADALGVTDKISAAWSRVRSALDTTLGAIGRSFEGLMRLVQPVIDALKWGLSSAGNAGGIIGRFFGHSSAGDTLQTNALGGPYGPGWHLTGERGPELKFESRSGYVANNRAMRQLASYADRVTASRDRFTPPQTARTARVEALFRPRTVGVHAVPTAAPGPVTQHITYTINAPGASAEEVIRLVERKSRQAAGNGLFDRGPSTGFNGR